MELEEIRVGRGRARQPDLPANDKEKSELRRLLGSIFWICGQKNFMHEVDVNFLITTVPVGTVAELLTANKLVRSIQQWRHHKLRIHSFEKTDRLEMTYWSDAAWANRPNGKDSTSGVFVQMSTQNYSWSFYY